jgi:acyl carrier protein
MNHIATVTRFVLDEFLPDVQEAELGPGYDLVEGGVIDSLGLLRLMAWLAERFDLPVDDMELDPDDFRSVASIAAFITQAAPAAAG